MSAALNFRASRSKKGAGRRRKGWLGGVESTALRERRTTMTGTRKYRRGGMGFFVLCENSRRGDGLWHQTKLNIASSLMSLPCSPEYRRNDRIDVQLQEKRNLILDTYLKRRKKEIYNLIDRISLFAFHLFYFFYFDSMWYLNFISTQLLYKTFSRSNPSKLSEIILDLECQTRNNSILAAFVIKFHDKSWSQRSDKSR